MSSLLSLQNIGQVGRHHLYLVFIVMLFISDIHQNRHINLVYLCVNQAKRFKIYVEDRGINF